MRFRSSYLECLLLLALGCGPSGMVQRVPQGGRCPPPGVELPLAQAFSEMAPGCDFVITADFQSVANDSGGCSGVVTLNGVSPSDMCIRVTKPGTTGLAVANFHMVRILDPSKRSLMYGLAQGTRLRLRGEQWVSTDHTIPLFDAKQVEVVQEQPTAGPTSTAVQPVPALAPAAAP